MSESDYTGEGSINSGQSSPTSSVRHSPVRVCVEIWLKASFSQIRSSQLFAECLWSSLSNECSVVDFAVTKNEICVRKCSRAFPRGALDINVLSKQSFHSSRPFIAHELCHLLLMFELSPSECISALRIGIKIRNFTACQLLPRYRALCVSYLISDVYSAVINFHHVSAVNVNITQKRGHRWARRGVGICYH